MYINFCYNFFVEGKNLLQHAFTVGLLLHCQFDDSRIIIHYKVQALCVHLCMYMYVVVSCTLGFLTNVP